MQGEEHSLNAQESQDGRTSIAEASSAARLTPGRAWRELVLTDDLDPSDAAANYPPSRITTTDAKHSIFTYSLQKWAAEEDQVQGVTVGMNHESASATVYPSGSCSMADCQEPSQRVLVTCSPGENDMEMVRGVLGVCDNHAGSGYTAPSESPESRFRYMARCYDEDCSHETCGWLREDDRRQAQPSQHVEGSSWLHPTRFPVRTRGPEQGILFSGGRSVWNATAEDLKHIRHRYYGQTQRVCALQYKDSRCHRTDCSEQVTGFLIAHDVLAVCNRAQPTVPRVQRVWAICEQHAEGPDDASKGHLSVMRAQSCNDTVNDGKCPRWANYDENTRCGYHHRARKRSGPKIASGAVAL